MPNAPSHVPGAMVVLWAPFPPVMFSAGDRRPRDIAIGLAAMAVKTVILAPDGTLGRPALSAQDPAFEHLSPRRFSRGSILDRVGYWLRVFARCRRRPDDLFVFYNPPLLGSACAWVLRTLGGAVLVEICDRNSLGEQAGRLRRTVHAFAERCAVFGAGGCLVVCEDLARWVRGLASAMPVAVAPVMVDTSAFRFGAAEPSRARKSLQIGAESPLVVYAGSFHRQEGVQELIHAFAAAKREFPDARLVLAGKSPDPQVLESLLTAASGCGVREYVLMPGFLDTAALADLLSAADVLVLPQLDVALNRSALPTKLAEYAASGRAILSTDVGDVRRYFVDGESIWLARDPSAAGIAQGLRVLLSDADLRGRIGRGASDVACRLSPEHAVRTAVRSLMDQGFRWRLPAGDPRIHTDPDHGAFEKDLHG